ncbi:MAG: acyl-CoA reductase [Alicyclobacillus sp.]|nr:acyl-CoA reductase [Alicyclobacillus sp.]
MNSQTSPIQTSATLPLWWLPPGITPAIAREDRLTCGVCLLWPEVTPALLHTAAHAVREAQTDLKRRPVAEVIAGLSAAAARWLDPAYPLRRMAEQVLPEWTGFAPDTVRLELKRLFRSFRVQELWRFLAEDFANPAVLDTFVPGPHGGLRKAFGPPLIWHVLSGNVPGVTVWSLVTALLVKAGSLAKTSASEPVLAPLFLQSLAEVSPGLAACAAVLPWPGNRTELAKVASAEASAVAVYGSDTTVAAVQAHLPAHLPVLRYGHKVSLALIGREALTPDRCSDTCQALAEDISAFDQQSCMSPQVVWVESGGAVDPQSFAARLAHALRQWGVRRPRARLNETEAMAIQAFRTEHEMAAWQDPGVHLWPDGEAEAPWTVVFHDSPVALPTPLFRTVRVCACPQLESAVPQLQPLRPWLQSAGIAVHPARLLHISDLLGSIGVSRVCAVGHMLRAAPGWHHDGRPSLADWVHWTDIEWTAERGVERYDPDVE